MKRRIPSLNWLRVFEAAARTESFARAAERLNISAAAVSQQIKALEGHVGHPLFTRGAHEVTLTDAGRAFWPTVSEAINAVEIRAATLFGSEAAQPLTVRATLILACSWLSSRLRSFQSANPDVALHLISDARSATDPGEDVELKIIFGNAEEGWAERDRLFGEHLFPVALPEISKSIRSADDLLRYQLIEIADHRAGWFRLFDRFAVDADLAQIVITDRTDVSLAMAASGCGIALARAPATDAMVERYGLRRCLSDFEVGGVDSYYLTFRSRVNLSPAAARFREWLLDQARFT
jgi:LysR family glycine cleavage system transcriptional activator